MSAKIDPSTFVQNPLTGAVRENKVGKGRFDLIPYEALRQLALHYEAGGVAHGDRNWEKGLPLASYFNSAFRHLSQWAEGDATENHLAAALWNICGIIHHEKAIKEGRLPVDLLNIPCAVYKQMKEPQPVNPAKEQIASHPPECVPHTPLDRAAISKPCNIHETVKRVVEEIEQNPDELGRSVGGRIIEQAPSPRFPRKLNEFGGQGKE